MRLRSRSVVVVCDITVTKGPELKTVKLHVCWQGGGTETLELQLPPSDPLLAGGGETFLRLFDECRAVASACGFPLRPHFLEMCTNMFTTQGSPIKASMLRDIERGSATEGEHVIGDLATRAKALGIETPVLDLARIHLAAYEFGRTREAAAS